MGLTPGVMTHACIIPALQRLGQEKCVFETSPNHTMKHCLKITKKNEIK